MDSSNLGRSCKGITADAADLEHAKLLCDFWKKHCPAVKDELLVFIDPAFVSFGDVYNIVCDLLGFAFL